MTAADKNKQTKKNVKDLKAQLERLGYGPYVTSGTKASTSIDELRRTFRKKKAKQDRDETPPVPQASCRGRVARELPADAGRSESTGEAVVYRRGLPRVHRQHSQHEEPSHEAVVLTEATDGEIVTAASGRTYYRLCRAAGDVPNADDLDERFAAMLSDDCSVLSRKVAEVLPEGAATEDLIFMDIETTGLASSPLFLIGIMAWSGQGFTVRQFLARNYAEERPVIEAFVEACAERRLLVTFNGKSFDFPYIRTRAAATGMPFALDPAHLDLLHVSRGFWRHRLPNCKLQTLERFVCRRQRHGDIPGSEIPQAYHTYVRTDDAHQIVQVLEHNMLDLVTLADIMTRFPDEH